MKTSRAFTLIELLVVVLIIAILAAVALPQYQKAVWRSRNTQLKTLVSNVAKAQESFYLANGEYAKSLNQLDIDLPSWTSAKTSQICLFETLNVNDAVRYTQDFLIGITKSGGIYGFWITGTYKCGGFAWITSAKKLFCTEREKESGHTGVSPAGKFCEQVEKATYRSQPSTWRYYN